MNKTCHTNEPTCIEKRERSDGGLETLGAAEGTHAPQHIRNTIALHFAQAPRTVSLNDHALPAAAVEFDQTRSILRLRISQSGEQQKIAVRW